MCSFPSISSQVRVLFYNFKYRTVALLIDTLDPERKRVLGLRRGRRDDINRFKTVCNSRSHYFQYSSTILPGSDDRITGSRVVRCETAGLRFSRSRPVSLSSIGGTVSSSGQLETLHGNDDL